MIKTKQDLLRYREAEKKIYLSDSKKGHLKQIATGDPSLQIFRFLKIVRKEEYHHNNGGLFHKLSYLRYHRKRNKLGLKLGIELWDNSFEEGLTIAHAGNIVVNGKARIGKNCILHGSNCIGNNGKSSDCPVIGDNARLGVGARVLGGVTLGDNVTVAAGAVVVHSFEESGITLAGVPAKRVR
ncbi:MAG: serine acetyltransferase [Clostridia bacterium]|nr:serine acetyltransferase [Clostridia bacterium]